ncbi:MAG TPA: hypothetical protein VLG38_02490 [Gammaproteobacteria bacterium]|nr:hypothetical protein [Gammaproteobacteria bacterium]
MGSSINKDNSVQHIIEKQRLLIEEHNKDLINLHKKLAEYEHTITEKDFYLAKLEMDLEHAIGQCKKIAAAKYHEQPNWIVQQEPGLDNK